MCLLLLAVTTSVIVVLVLRLFARWKVGVCNSGVNMKGKTVIVTGANSGIGKETARDLAKRGARVILACRNLETANQAKESIVKSSENNDVVVMKLDLSSLESIRQFADEFKSKESRLDVLVHNAGTAQMFRKQVTVDGLEMTMATNHFGPFLLTHLLIDLMKRTSTNSPCRIVVVASELYRLAGLNVQNLNPVNGFPAYLYYVSKYANIVFTLELARRLHGTRITANCLHPGMIDSGIWRNVPFPINLPLQLIIKGFFKNTTEGAQTTLHLCVSEEVENVTGKYFMDCKETNLSAGTQDESLAKKVWEVSEQMVKLKEGDPHI